jgi:putative endonuclease
MTFWSVYIIECNDGKLYTGITTDIKRRLKEHNVGKGAKFTAPLPRRPVKLVYLEKMGSERSVALIREYAIKAMRKLDKLKLIAEKRAGS